jgi:predicted ATP-grasp superfamily ATP-dependent carboligase
VVPLYDDSVAASIASRTVVVWLVNEDGKLPTNYSRVTVGIRANPDDVHMYYDTIKEAIDAHGLTSTSPSLMAFLRDKDPNERLNYYTLVRIASIYRICIIYRINDIL